MGLKWNGEALKRKLREAQIEGIDTTMAACVLHAKQNHGAGAHAQGRFVTQPDASLERSVDIKASARPYSRGVIGVWGSTNIRYAHRIEIGFQGKDAKGRVVDAPAYPYLRPAAQVEYPKLADRIRASLKRQR